MLDDVCESIHSKLHKIRDLAQKIQDVPNFGPDLWTMRKLDEDAQRIQQICLWIGKHLMPPSCPWHDKMIRAIRKRIHSIYNAAREIEAVPNFGPDLWTMRDVDRKCEKIKTDSLWIEEKFFKLFESV